MESNSRVGEPEGKKKKERGQQVCCEFGVPLTHILTDLDLLYLHCAQEQSRQLTLITEQHSPDIMRRRPQAAPALLLSHTVFTNRHGEKVQTHFPERM